MRRPSSTLLLCVLAASVALALLIDARFLWATASPRQEIEAVWQRVQQAGAYKFQAEVTQLLTPQSAPGNAGRTSKSTTLYLEGQNDLAAKSLHMNLWSAGGSVLKPETGVQFKLEKNRAYTRQGNGAWQEADDLTSLFAPSGDFLSYIRAAEGVQRHSPEVLHTIGGDLWVTRYTFDINGRRFAEQIRPHLRQLAAREGLPPGVDVALPRVYVEMTGKGELWVGADGLPLRQRFELHFPERADHYLPSAQATVDFSDFNELPPATRLGQAIRMGSSLVRHWASPTMFVSLAMTLLMMLFVGVLILHRRARPLYVTVTVSVIVALVMTPLLRSDRVRAFSNRQMEQQRTQQAKTEEQESQAALVQEIAQPTIDPHTDPLAQADPASPVGTTATSQSYYDARCQSDPSSDIDADGLTNLQECLLGTLLDVADTDGDGLEDGVEVAGVVLTGNDGTNRTWYTDPTNQDTNRDGIDDGREWGLDVNQDGLADDSDGDGEPDIWDLDNDGDGVPDSLDLSPFTTTRGSAPYGGDNPFQLIVSDLAAGHLVKVEFQLSPTEADHLWYTQNVLDWPDEDRRGPIQDSDGATFFDVDASLSASPNDNGDMRLVPMLEIAIEGAPDNLPPQDILSQFGISVQQTSETEQRAYLPLQLVTDQNGDRHVAFYGAMYYRATGDWGTAHSVRLVWLVQVLADQCEAYTNGVCSEYGAMNELQVIQRYDDDWFLTGLHVSEEHGSDMDILYEDPVATAAAASGQDKPLYMDALYGLLYGLDHTFLAGSDCDTLDSSGSCVGNGQRDIDTAEIERRFNHTTNSGISSQERWNLPNVFSVERRSYEALDLALMDTAITQTVRVLDQVFTSAWSATSPITPTIMFAYEQNSRSLNLDETLANSANFNFAGNRLNISLPTTGANAVELTTLASVKWAPYTYAEATGWEMADIQAYYEDLALYLGPSFNDVDDPQVADTYTTMTKLLYVTVHNGENRVVQNGGTRLSADYQQADGSLAVTLVADLGHVLQKAVNAYFVVTPELTSIAEIIEAGGQTASSSAVLNEFLAINTLEYRTTAGGIAKGVFGIILVVLYAVSLFVQYVLHDTSSPLVFVGNLSALILISITSIVMPIMQVIESVQGLMELGDGLATALYASLTTSAELVGTTRAAGIIGLIISVAISVGIFLYLVASGKVRAGTIAFNMLVATTIASIIMAVLFYVLSLSVVGLILVGLVAIIDLFLLLIGVGWSITGWLTAAIAGAIYKFNVLEKIDVQAGQLDMALANPNAGLVEGNEIVFTLPITTVLSSKRDADKLTTNSLVYELSHNKEKLSTDFKEREGEWIVSQSGSRNQAMIAETVTLTTTLQSGINTNIPLLLNSAYALKGEECWIGICSARNLRGSDSTDFGEGMVLDVLPATLAEFVALEWSAGQVRFMDADGDGLLSLEHGGVDPDDSTWDTDGDTLSDAYELSLRNQPSTAGGVDLDPRLADSDGDGVSDDVEIRNGTNPGVADTDGDGLSDIAEIAPGGGWLLAYAPDKQTRVWSDPLRADADGDGLSDLFEQGQDTCAACAPWADPDNPKVYHPWVWNESPVALYVENSSINDIVRPGETFIFTTTTANHLGIGQNLAGNLSLNLPGGFSGAPLAATVDVASGNSESLVSVVTADTSQSGHYVISSKMNLTDFQATVWSWDRAQSHSANLLHGSAAGPAIANPSGWNYPYVIVMREKGGISGYMASADGTLQTSAMLYSALNDVQTAPSIACADDGVCLAIFGDQFGTTGVVLPLVLRGTLNNPGGTIVWGAENTIVHAPTVATNGSDFMVAWAAISNGETQLWVQAVNKDGSLNGDPQPLTGAGSDLGAAALAWNGLDYVAVWRNGANLHRALVSAAGQVSDESVIGPGTGWPTVDGGETTPLLAFDAISQQTLLLYRASVAGNSELHFRRLTVASATEPATLATGASLNTAGVQVALCADPINSGWAAAWSLPGEGQIAYQAISPDGSLRAAGSVTSAGTEGIALACERPQPALLLEFDEAAGATHFADSSGFGNNMSCQPPQCPLAGEEGHSGSSIRFDGVDDLLAGNVSQSEKTFTTELWFKTSQQNGTMLHRQQNKKRIFIFDGNLCASVQVVSSNQTQTDALCSEKVNYADGNWHHAVHTAAGGVHRLYVDGRLVGTSQPQTFASCSSSCGGFTMGGDSSYFAGWLDAVRFYNRSLSTNEVEDAFSSAIAIYDLDEPAGSAAFINAAHNGFNITCTGNSCPELGVPGVAYTAAQFDGVDDVLSINPVQTELARFVYDFESSVDPAWSTSSTGEVVRAGVPTRFLGPVGSSEILLDFSNLPVHDTIEVTFDLYVLGEWGGNSTINGPDDWQWGYNGNPIFRTNFSTLGNTPGFYQLYPAQSWKVSGVKLYNDRQCTEQETILTADTPDLSKTSVGNNHLSCHKIANDTVAFLYEQTNYGGKRWLLDPKRGISEEYPNDEIGSVRVWAAANVPGHGAVETLSYQGKFNQFVYRFKQTIPNHTASSLQLNFEGLMHNLQQAVWGLDNVIVSVQSSSSSLPLTNSSFTLSAWAKRSQTGEAHMLLSQGKATPNQGLHFGFRANNHFTCAFWNNDLNTSVAYNDTEWHHWACTYDANSRTRTLYRDGVKIAQDIATANYRGFGATVIGQRFDGQWPFRGAIDEVAIWTEALTASEIATLASKIRASDENVVLALLPATDGGATVALNALALRESATELGTTSQTVTRTITVDNDLPTVTIQTPTSGAYIRGDRLVSISGVAADATTSVEQVAVQVANGAWQTASGSEAWSYLLDPSGLPEGVLSLSARAMDMAGNAGEVATRQFVLDRTPPTVSATGTQFVPYRDAQGRWYTRLSGQVHDPAVGGQPGSGVAAVEVLLQGQEGLAGNDWQRAVISNTNTWSVDYILPNIGDNGNGIADPSGIYTLTLRAIDGAGNRTASAALQLVPIKLDATGPTITLDVPISTTELISTPQTLRGRATDATAVTSVEVNFTPAQQIAALSGTILHLPLDENGPTPYFADQSGANHAAVCEDARCPMTAQVGQRDQAIQFEAGDALVVSGIDLANRSFSLGAWVKRSAGGRVDLIYGQGSGGQGQGLTFGFLADDRFRCGFGQDDLETPNAYADLDWHHWLCTYDAETRVRTIYRDGVQVAQDTASAHYSGSGDLLIGRGFDSGDFVGLLDEATVHDRALVAYEAADLYAYGQGVWESASLSSDPQPSWSFTLPVGDNGLEGIYQINVRGTDALGNVTPLGGQRLWRGEIDTRPPQLSLFYRIEDQAAIAATRYMCNADDLNLVQNNTCLPVAPESVPAFRNSDITALTTYDMVNPWYGAVTSDTMRLYSMSAFRSYSGTLSTDLSVQACDRYAHCATAEALPIPGALPPGSKGVEILEPASGSVLSTFEPVPITGAAYDEDGLQALYVSMDGDTIFQRVWEMGESSAIWRFWWTPPAEGIYHLQPLLADLGTSQPSQPVSTTVDKLDDGQGVSTQLQMGKEVNQGDQAIQLFMPRIFSSSTLYRLYLPILQTAILAQSNFSSTMSVLYVDVTPPVVEIESQPVSMQEAQGERVVELSGQASDNVLLHRVEVSVDQGSWQSASIAEDGSWRVAVRLPHAPDGETLEVIARAEDIAGHTTTVTESIYIDTVAPVPGEIKLAYVNTAGQRLPVQPGEQLSDAQSLELSWGAASDGGGTVTYQAGFSTTLLPDFTDLTSYDEPGTHPQPVDGEARWYAHIRSIDELGNSHIFTVGPIYVK